MSLTKIGSIGINTGIAFAGVTTIVTLNTANDALSIGATVNVGSGITLGASGDIFATGVSTFSGNLKVGSGVTISPDGDGFYTGVVTATSYAGSGANLTGIDTDLVSDTSPQLGGDLDTNSHEILLDASHSVKFATNQGQIYHSGSAMYIGTNDLRITNYAVNETMAKFVANGAVDLYYNDSKKFETISTGVVITGSDDGDGGAKGDFKFFQTDGTLKIMFDASTSQFEFLDNSKASFGSGDDLKIYHDGTDSWLYNTTGVLNIRQANGGNINLQPYGGENGIIVKPNGAVELYYDNSKKIETTSSGVTITDDLLLDGSANLGNYIRTNYDGGGHLYFRNNSQGANYSSHFQTYLSSDEAGTVQTHIHYYHGGYCELQHQGDSVLRTLADGVQFRDGGAVKGQFTDEGLCFGTDTAAANALDDYEEGTFTPALTRGYSSISYTYQNGFYTKIGNVVHFTIYIYVASATGDNDYIQISLPFTSVNDTRREPGAYRNYDNGTFSTSTDDKSTCCFLIGRNVNYILAIKPTSGALIYGNDTELGTGANNKYIHLSGTMYV